MTYPWVKSAFYMEVASFVLCMEIAPEPPSPPQSHRLRKLAPFNPRLGLCYLRDLVSSPGLIE